MRKAQDPPGRPPEGVVERRQVAPQFPGLGIHQTPAGLPPRAPSAPLAAAEQLTQSRPPSLAKQHSLPAPSGFGALHAHNEW
mmetsp:Transcript_120955/g.270283  ORF Transcript_120955/g.270283 Transcript_120955/m.270283 type:complete len:82 (+) Transcript_120955:1060-1305(+)